MLEATERKGEQMNGKYSFSIESFGKRLRFIRTELGYTQDRLAEEAGLDARQIRRYEAGQQCPTVIHMEAIVRVLKVPVWRLMDMDRETAETVFGLHADTLVPPTVELQVLLQTISDRFAALNQQLQWVRDSKSI